MKKEIRVKSLHNQQENLITEIYRLTRIVQTKEEHDRILRLNEDFNSCVNDLLEILGEDAHCAEIDSDLYECFLNVFKDREGFKKRDASYKFVKNYLEKIKISQKTS